jgi:hypothetical protein
VIADHIVSISVVAIDGQRATVVLTVGFSSFALQGTNLSQESNRSPTPGLLKQTTAQPFVRQPLPLDHELRTQPRFVGHCPCSICSE